MIKVEQVKNSNISELRKYAKELGVTNASRMNKTDLQAKLIDAIENPITITKETPKAFFDRVSKLTNINEIERECKALIEWLGTEKIEARSKANKLQPYSKLFKELTPNQETVHLFFDFRSTPDKPAISRHLFFKFTGLADIDWDEANEKVRQRRESKPTDELAEALNEENKIFSLTRYLNTVQKLLNSTDCWELGVGLIAASGRRPSEIAMFGNFQTIEAVPSYITYPEYAIKVNGLAKKRDKDPTTVVSLLIPTNEFLQALETFRAMPELRKYRETFNNLIDLGYDRSDAWNRIEDSIGNKFRDVTNTYFEFLPKIDDGQNRKNILLRACTLKLITMRDYPKASNKARLQYAGVLAGHIIPIFRDNRVVYDGQTSASTLNYDDYEPDTTDIPLLSNVLKITEEIKETEDMVRIAQLESTIADLQAQLAAKDAEIALLKNRTSYSSLPKPEASDMTTEQLMKTRKPGSTEEKIRRCYQAIVDYNNSDKTEDRLNPTAKILSEMTGCNRKVIGDWLETHNDEVISHRAKFEMNEYYNNRYRKHPNYVTTEMLIEKIERDYLK